MIKNKDHIIDQNDLLNLCLAADPHRSIDQLFDQLTQGVAGLLPKVRLSIWEMTTHELAVCKTDTADLLNNPLDLSVWNSLASQHSGLLLSTAQRDLGPVALCTDQDQIYIQQLAQPFLLILSGQQLQAALDHGLQKLLDQYAKIIQYKWREHPAQAETALLLPNQLYDHLFKHAFEGLMIYCYKQQKILDCNQKVLDYLQCDKSTLISQRTPFHFSPAFQSDGKSSEAAQKQIEAIMAVEDQHIFEWTFRLPNQRIKEAEISFFRLPDPERAISCLVIRDTTEWKKTQELIIQRDIQLKLAQDIAKIGSFYFDYTRKKFYWSEGLKKIFNTDKVLSGADYFDRIHPEDRENHREDIRKLTQDGIAYEAVIRLINPTDHFTYLSFKSQPILNDRKVKAAIGVVQDITDQYRTALELANSRKRLSLVLQASDLGTWDWNIKTGQVVYNDRWAEMLGYTKEEIAPHDQAFNELLHPDDVNRTLSLIQQHLEGRSPFFEMEIRMRHKDGSYKWIYDRGKITEHDPSGKPSRATGIHMDITDRIENEQLLATERERNQVASQALKHSERSLKEAQKLAKIGNWEFDLRTGDIFWSDAIFDIFNIEERQTPNYEQYLQLIIPEDRNKVREAVKLCIAKGEPYEIEIRHQKADEAIVYTMAHAKAVYEDSEVIKIIGTVQDITEQKLAEQIMVETNKKYIDLFENMYDALLTTDANGRFINYNKSAQKILGYSFNELSKLHISDIVHPDDMERSKEFLTQLMEKGYYSNYQGRIINKKGEITYVQVNSNAIYDNGKFIGSRDIVRDITELVEANRKREQLLKELADVNAELKDFAYIVSHDLKAPLRGISSLAQWLSMDYKDKLDEAGQQQINLLVSRVNRMHNFIEGILEYSRIGRIKEEKEKIDLNELIHQIGSDMDLPDSFSIVIKDRLPTIYAERIRMKQLFQNLISNASKYNDKANPQVTISHWVVGDATYFEVKDNGPGIDEKYFEKVFQIFQTLQPRDRFESTGIGLTIVKRIVQQYEGTISINAKMGQFTSFVFSLKIVTFK